MPKNMNISQIARIVAKDTGRTVPQVEDTIWRAFNIIAQTLAAGEKVSIQNFGTFSTYERPAHPGLNILTREILTVPAQQVARLKPTGRLKEMVRAGDTAASIRRLPSGRAAVKKSS